MESPENDSAVFRPSHKPWKSMKPIPTFPPPRPLRRGLLLFFLKTRPVKRYAFWGQGQWAVAVFSAPAFYRSAAMLLCQLDSAPHSQANLSLWHFDEHNRPSNG